MISIDYYFVSEMLIKSFPIHLHVVSVQHVCLFYILESLYKRTVSGGASFPLIPQNVVSTGKFSSTEHPGVEGIRYNFNCIQLFFQIRIFSGLSRRRNVESKYECVGRLFVFKYMGASQTEASAWKKFKRCFGST